MPEDSKLGSESKVCFPAEGIYDIAIIYMQFEISTTDIINSILLLQHMELEIIMLKSLHL